MIGRVLRDRAADCRRHPVVAACVAAAAAGDVLVRAGDGRAAKALVYVATMLVAALVADVVLALREGPGAPLPVRRPARETAWLVGLTALGGAWLVFAKFFPERWDALPRLARLALSLAGAACVFQVASAVYLLAKRYRPAELGLRPRGLLVAPAVLVLVAAAAVVVDPDGVTLGRAVEEFGWWGLLAFAFFGEPLAEEFLRLTFQTRLGALFGNRAAGWLLAAVPWALLHVPVWYAKSGDLAGALGGAVCLLPIGLLWGYLTLRTGSLWPALLVHGFNLWGLQNP